MHDATLTNNSLEPKKVHFSFDLSDLVLGIAYPEEILVGLIKRKENIVFLVIEKNHF